ncbi:hypothetical protein BH10BDE1_BH10BDE1_34840 [soil metagenome]
MKNTSHYSHAFLSLLLLAFASLSPNSAIATTTFRIDHAYKSILRDIPLESACVTESEVRSLTPVRTCIRLDSSIESHRGNTEPVMTWSCGAYANVTPSYPRTIETRTCAQYEPAKPAEYSTTSSCLRFTYGTLTLPRTIEIQMTPILTRDAPDPASRTETVTFPDCP